MKWYAVEARMRELEDKQNELLDDYKGISELISEDIEEEDMASLKNHVAALTEIAQDLSAVLDELDHLCDMVDNACEEERYGKI